MPQSAVQNNFCSDSVPRQPHATFFLVYPKRSMTMFAKFAAVAATLPIFLSPASAVLAQTTNPFADWRYLYTDSFENSVGQNITQEWWLSPEQTRQNNQLRFTLLARRSPVSDNGTAAALFGYVANCDSMMHAIESAQYLDISDQPLNPPQNMQQAMQSTDPNSQFYSTLSNLCSGAY